MKLKSALYVIKEFVDTKSKEKTSTNKIIVDKVTINYNSLAEIIVYKKHQEIFKIINLSLKNYVLDEAKNTKETKELNSLINKIIKNRLGKVQKSIKELNEEKRKILEEAKNIDSDLFNVIKFNLAKEIETKINNENLKNKIIGTVSFQAGKTFEKIVEDQIKNKSNEPVKGLWTFIKTFFYEWYSIDILDDFVVTSGQSITGSYDLQIVYKPEKRNFSFLNIHCKFLSSKKTKTSMGWKNPHFKLTDMKGVLEAIKKLTSISTNKKAKEKYIKESKSKTGQFTNYVVDVSQIFKDVGLTKLNENIDDTRTLLRISYSEIFVIGDKYYSIDKIEKIEKKGDEYFLLNKDREKKFILSDTKKGQLRIA